MSALTHEEAIKRAEYIGQVAEAELFETDRRGGYSSKLKDAIHETQLPRLSRHSVSGGWATFFMPLHELGLRYCRHKAARRFSARINLLRMPSSRTVTYTEGGVVLSGY